LIPSADISLNEVLSEHLSSLSEWFGKMAEEETPKQKKMQSSKRQEKFSGVNK
jgi:hypothetical protein